MRWLLVPLAALVLAPTAAPAQVPKACSLLTPAQVAKALGAKAEWHQAGGNRRYQMCTWHGPMLSASTGAHPQLMLMVTKVTKAQFRRAENQSLTAQPVHGVGELAYASGPGGGFLEVWSRGYDVTVTASVVRSPLAAAKQAANAAIGNL
jgi:hypothetical protein